MQMKSLLNLEVTKNERLYSFSIPTGAPYGEAYDAIFSCLEMIIDLQKKGVDQLKTQNNSNVTESTVQPS